MQPIRKTAEFQNHRTMPPQKRVDSAPERGTFEFRKDNSGNPYHPLMNSEGTHPLADDELNQLASFSQYVAALKHLAPGCVKTYRQCDESGSGVDNPWNVSFPRGDEFWHVSVKRPPQDTESPLFWREPVILRMLEALRNNLTAKRPLQAWPQGVKAAWSLIAQHPSKPMSLGEVASCLNLSAGYLGARVEQVLGSTFRCLLRDERVALSCRLLLGTELQISEIAGQLGGQSLSQFNRNFASATGLSPRSYRAKFGPTYKDPVTPLNPPPLTYC
jgi:AraC-like DNA-binding protein